MCLYKTKEKENTAQSFKIITEGAKYKIYNKIRGERLAR